MESEAGFGHHLCGDKGSQGGGNTESMRLGEAGHQTGTLPLRELRLPGCDPLIPFHPAASLGPQPLSSPLSDPLTYLCPSISWTPLCPVIPTMTSFPTESLLPLNFRSYLLGPHRKSIAKSLSASLLLGWPVPLQMTFTCYYWGRGPGIPVLYLS